MHVHYGKHNTAKRSADDGRSWSGLRLDGGTHQAKKLSDSALVDPARHYNKIVLRVDPDDIGARPDGGIGGGRSFWPFAVVRIEPPKKTVSGPDGAGRAKRVYPSRRQQGLAVPLTGPVDQQAKAGMVVGIDVDSAAPMGATGNRLHPLAVNIDESVVVSMPRPGVGSADRIHDTRLQNLGQRCLEEMK